VLADSHERAEASSTIPMHGAGEAADAVRRALEQVGHGPAVEAVGHRVVHGGSLFTRTTLIDDDVLRQIRELASLAPLHNPVAAEVIAAARAALPGVPHAAAFDSAFHATLPKDAYVYALPYSWFADWGYRRYGFHGLSVSGSAERAAALLRRDDLGIVVAHLGAGCSVTAVSHGRSVSTSMGMTPLEGLVMGTRAGSVDPGVLLAAQREHRLDASALENALERESGLLGISGRTAEMKDLIELARVDERAALAVAVFVRAAAGAIAAAATSLTRLDALVFTGGIGEHAASVRAGICDRLGTLGVPPLIEPPSTGDRVIASGPVAVLVIEAREDAVIAREVRALA